MSSAAPINAAVQSTAPSADRSRRAPADVIIATLAHGRGETGVHTHGRALLSGLREAGFGCRTETPLSGGRKWLVVFALRRLIIHPINKTWSTRWYRKWHLAALRGQLTRQLAEGGASAIIAQCPISASAALDARQKARVNCPIAMVCHFNYSEATEYRDKGELADERYFQDVLAFEKSILQSVDQVIYVSDWARRIVEQERGIRPKASAVIWNGIDAAQSPQRLRRADIGLTGDDLVLMNVGTLEARKNQLGLVDLFARIAAEFPRARLVLAGEGPARQQIEHSVGRQALADKVRLLGFRKDVPDLLRLSDVYVHYASMENCPMVLLEAARAGLPLAAAATGGVPELLSELGGVSLDASDPARSLAALRPLLGDAQLRADAGKAAQQRFHQRFTLQAMIRQYVRVLGLSDSAGSS